jgi:hypothetical protein
MVKFEYRKYGLVSNLCWIPRCNTQFENIAEICLIGGGGIRLIKYGKLSSIFCRRISVDCHLPFVSS